MSESPLTRQGLPPVLADDLVRFYCNYIGENKKSDSCLATHENSRTFIWRLLCHTIQLGPITSPQLKARRSVIAKKISNEILNSSEEIIKEELLRGKS